MKRVTVWFFGVVAFTPLVFLIFHYSISYYKSGEVHAGIVVEKVHCASRTVIIHQPILLGKVMVLVPRVQHIPEKWSVKIQGKNGRNEESTRWISVYEGAFNTAEIGQSVTFQ